MIKQILLKTTHLTKGFSYLFLFLLLAQPINSHAGKGTFEYMSSAAIIPPAAQPAAACYSAPKYLGIKSKAKTRLKDFCEAGPELVSAERDNLILSDSTISGTPVSLESIRGLTTVAPDSSIIPALTYLLGSTSLDLLHTPISITSLLKSLVLHNIWLALPVEEKQKLVFSSYIGNKELRSLFASDPFYRIHLNNPQDSIFEHNPFLAQLLPHFHQVLQFPIEDNALNLKLYFPFLSAKMLQDFLNRLPSNQFRTLFYQFICISYNDLARDGRLSSEELTGAPLNYPYTLGLSAEEHSSLVGYTGAGYREPNKLLRGKAFEKQTQDGHTRDINHWQRSILRSSIPMWKASFRGDSPYAGMTSGRYFEKYKPGDVIVEDSFISTSANFSLAREWSSSSESYTFVYIGISGTSVAHLSNSPRENEIVYPRGIRWRVLRRDEPNRVIYLQEVISEIVSELPPITLDASTYVPSDKLDFSAEESKSAYFQKSNLIINPTGEIITTKHFTPHLISETWKDASDPVIPLYVQTMPPDGHCMYHSFIHGLQSIAGLPPGEQMPNSQQALRNRIAQFEQANFLPTAEFGVNQQHINGVLGAAWGNETEINAFCRIYNVKVIVFKPTVPHRLVYCADAPDERTIRVYYNGINHYDAVVDVLPQGGNGLDFSSLFADMSKIDPTITLAKFNALLDKIKIPSSAFSKVAPVGLYQNIIFDSAPNNSFYSHFKSPDFINLPDTSTPEETDLKKIIQEGQFKNEKSCGGPIHMFAHLQKIKEAKAKGLPFPGLSKLFPYTYADVDQSMQEISQTNMLSQEEELAIMLSEEGPKSFIASQYPALLDKINKFPPYLINRMDLDTLLNYFLKVGGIPNAVDSSAGVYSNNEEDKLYGAFQCAYTTVGPVHGFKKYGEILTVVKPNPTAFWLSDLTGWHFMQDQVSSGKASHDDLGTFHKKGKLINEISKHVYAPKDMHSKLAMMLTNSLAHGKSTYGVQAQQAPFVEDSAQLLRSLLDAPNSCEFWKVASGNPELAYLEAKFYGGIAFQDMVAIIIPKETIGKIPADILSMLQTKTKVLTYEEAVAQGIICP